MKILIASDIHGSYDAICAIIDRAEKEKAESIILLGDIYYHGPRNSFPGEYAPMKVAEVLNKRTDLTVVKGNCDSEVDEMISDFAFTENATLIAGGKKIFLTHGHKYNIDKIPPNCDVLIYGHCHTGFITEKDGITVANAGSAALPKNGTEKSYLLLDGDVLYLKNLNGEVLEKRGI